MTPAERELLLEMAARMTQAEKLDDARYWSLQHLIAAVEEEAAFVAEPQAELCPVCHGWGMGKKYADCPDCNGTGRKEKK